MKCEIGSCTNEADYEVSIGRLRLSGRPYSTGCGEDGPEIYNSCSTCLHLLRITKEEPKDPTVAYCPCSSECRVVLPWATPPHSDKAEDGHKGTVGDIVWSGLLRDSDKEKYFVVGADKFNVIESINGDMLSRPLLFDPQTKDVRPFTDKEYSEYLKPPPEGTTSKEEENESDNR